MASEAAASSWMGPSCTKSAKVARSLDRSARMMPSSRQAAGIRLAWLTGLAIAGWDRGEPFSVATAASGAVG